MNYLDKYIPEYQAFHGLRSLLSPYFINNEIEPNIVLNGLRQFLERLLYHLSIISGIEEKGIANKIDKFENAGVIDRQVTPYFHLWWKVACLGSHFQRSDIPDVISWKEHLDFCRQAAGICISWYVNKYPPLEFTRAEQQKWLDDASSVITVPFDQIQVCNKDEIEKHIDLLSTLVLYGRSWAGKTSIASYWVTGLCLRGYIPIVVHENSLVTFRIFSSDGETAHPKNLKLTTNAQTIHELVSTRLLHGDSFVIFLDDPFGHRKYQYYNPLMFLRIAEWQRLTSHPQTLGDIKVIITTPSVFLEEGRRTLAENAITNPISRENMTLLNDEYQIKIDINMYSEEQIRRIVEYSAYHHRCNWSGKPEFIEIVSEILRDKRLGFDALHILCRDYKVSSEDQFLEGVLNIARSADIQDEIHNMPNPTKIKLSAAYVGESLIELYREFRFQTELSFTELCSSSGQSISAEEQKVDALTDWLLEDRAATMNLSRFPVFSHPEVRFAVGNLTETVMRPIVQNILTNISGLSEEYKATALAKWESVHLLCRMASFVTLEQARIIHDDYLQRSEIRGGDPRNIIWAILGNWHYIEGSHLDRYARGFLKSVPHSFKSHARSLIWEATGNWTHLNEEIRFLVLSLSGRGDSLEDIEPAFHPQHTIAFLAAGVSYYNTIQDSARAGSQVSEKYIEFISFLIAQIAKSSRKNHYTSRSGDGLFDAPGSQFGSEDVLNRLKNLGLKRGTLNTSHPLISQINDLLR